MLLQYTEEEQAFRDELREFFRTAMPQDMRRRVLLGQRPTREDLVGWQRILDGKGWAVPMWPVQYGGTGWDAVKQYIFSEELLLTPALPPMPHVNQVGAVVIAHGTEEQKRRFLPKIRTMEWWFCQGFSEPGSGSDLASLKTRAVREGDHYVVNGQKLWTSQAHRSDWMYALVRTDPNARKQSGISYLLIDMKSPGVTIRPVISIDGIHYLNEVFFDNVKVPVENRLGLENKGWDYAKYTLGHERATIAKVGLSKARIAAAKRAAAGALHQGRPLADSAAFRERLALLEVELKALEITNMRVVAEGMKQQGHRLDPKTSILKMKGSELQQLALEMLLGIAGPQAMPKRTDFYLGKDDPELERPDWTSTIAPAFYMSRAVSIFGGSNEIQHNIVAKGVLGL